MHNQVLPQNDFFIYVPSQYDEMARPHFTANTTAVREDANTPANGDCWVKIRLAESLVVYACIRNVPDWSAAHN